MPMSADKRRAACAEALEQSASFVLRRTARIVGQYFDEALSPVGLKATQVTLLMVIDTHPDAPLHVIAEAAGLSPSTLSRNLQPLINAGLIEVSGSNRLGKHAVLTRPGARTLEKAFPLWEAVQDEFTSVYGDAAWKRLKNSARRASEAVETLREEE